MLKKKYQCIVKAFTWTYKILTLKLLPPLLIDYHKEILQFIKLRDVI